MKMFPEISLKILLLLLLLLLLLQLLAPLSKSQCMLHTVNTSALKFPTLHFIQYVLHSNSVMKHLPFVKQIQRV